MTKKESAYWIALAHMPGWDKLKINSLITKFWSEDKISIDNFFSLSPLAWKANYGLDDASVQELSDVNNHLDKFEQLFDHLSIKGIELLSPCDTEYPLRLRRNLDRSVFPSLIYIKGQRSLLSAKSLAIIGSKDAAGISLAFTDKIAQTAANEDKIVLSGFERGVDRQALDSVLRYGGKSIVILPQGITSLGSGYQKYSRFIEEGSVLIVSIFHPNAPWLKQQDLYRNTVILGLSDEIYVAESEMDSGVFQGAQDALSRGRKIFVRRPELGETNANRYLIKEGAIPVDFNGRLLTGYTV